MQHELETEAKADKEMYEKLSCWCSNTGGAKESAVAEAEAAIAQLESEIEQRSKAGEQLDQDIAAGDDDVKKLQASLLRAESEREQEYASNRKDIGELRTNLDVIKRAIYVLRQHQATAFPQLKLDFLERDSHAGDMDKLSRWMEAHDFADLSQKDLHRIDADVAKKMPSKQAKYQPDELDLLRKAQKLVVAFTQQGAGHSGEILGIMDQLKDNFAKELDELEKTDAQQAQEFAEMAEQLKKAVAEAERGQKRRTQQAAENNQARVDAIQALDDTKTALGADTKFLLQMKEQCKATDEEWAARTKARGEELTAISEALQILASDDNNDLFSKSLGFLQLMVRRRRVSVKSLAKSLVAKSLVEVDLAKFPKVNKAIDDMVAGLTQQQQEEVEHKDWCKSQLHSLEMETTAKTQERDGLTARIEDAKATLQAIAEEVTASHAEIATSLQTMQGANVDRQAESMAFQQMVADQRATVEVLYKALDKLAAVYEPKLEAFIQLDDVPSVLAARKRAAAEVAAAKTRAEAEIAAAQAKAAGEVEQAESQAAKTTAKSEVKVKVHDVKTHVTHSSVKSVKTDVKTTHALAAHPASHTKGNHSAALVQGGQRQPQAPGKFDTYKQHQGSGSVLVMLRGVIKDAQDLEKEAIRDENEAVAAYGSFVTETQEVVASLQRKVVSLTERKATAEGELAADEHSLEEAEADLAGLSRSTADTHKACDFVLENFDVRQQARQKEIDGLKQAKAVLAGAS